MEKFGKNSIYMILRVKFCKRGSGIKNLKKKAFVLELEKKSRIGLKVSNKKKTFERTKKWL